MQDTCYLIKFDTKDSAEVYNSLLNYAGTLEGVAAARLTGTSAQIKLDKTADPIAFELQTTNELFGKTVTTVLVTFPIDDRHALNFVRFLGSHTDMRTYSVKMGCFLPKNLDLLIAQTSRFTANVLKTFQLYQLTPIYLLSEKNVLYALDAQQYVHIINTGLLDYYNHFGVETKESNEFNYPVANSLAEFTALFDQSLVPTDFYERYQKDPRIVNYSNINIFSVHRKIFFKPYIFTYSKDRQEFQLLTTEKAILQLADKIRPGENLPSSINRCLAEELHLPLNFAFARISRFVEFDRDRENRLTPRLQVAIYYFDPIIVPKETRDQFNRGWVSLNKLSN